MRREEEGEGEQEQRERESATGIRNTRTSCHGGASFLGKFLRPHVVIHHLVVHEAERLPFLIP